MAPGEAGCGEAAEEPCALEALADLTVAFLAFLALPAAAA
jgi:hypothetical protein